MTPTRRGLGGFDFMKGDSESHSLEVNISGGSSSRQHSWHTTQQRRPSGYAPEGLRLGGLRGTESRAAALEAKTQAGKRTSV